MPELLLMRVGGIRCGVWEADVFSTEPPRRLYRLPLWPAFVAGISRADGKNVLVFDLEVCLGVRASSSEGARSILWLCGGDRQRAFEVQSIIEQVEIADADVLAVPHSIRSAGIEQCVRSGKKLVPLVDVAGLWDEVERAGAAPARPSIPSTLASQFKERFLHESLEVVDVTFHGHRFALPASEVEVVSGVLPLVPMPSVPPPFAGVAVYEEVLLPVVDIAPALGLPPCVSPASQMVVVENGDLRLLLLVDSVGARHSIPLSDQREIPLPIVLPHAPVYGFYFDASRVGLVLNVAAIVMHFDEIEARSPIAAKLRALQSGSRSIGRPVADAVGEPIGEATARCARESAETAPCADSTGLGSAAPVAPGAARESSAEGVERVVSGEATAPVVQGDEETAAVAAREPSAEDGEEVASGEATAPVVRGGEETAAVAAREPSAEGVERVASGEATAPVVQGGEETAAVAAREPSAEVVERVASGEATAPVVRGGEETAAVAAREPSAEGVERVASGEATAPVVRGGEEILASEAARLALENESEIVVVQRAAMEDYDDALAVTAEVAISGSTSPHSQVAAGAQLAGEGDPSAEPSTESTTQPANDASAGHLPPGSEGTAARGDESDEGDVATAGAATNALLLGQIHSGAEQRPVTSESSVRAGLHARTRVAHGARAPARDASPGATALPKSRARLASLLMLLLVATLLAVWHLGGPRRTRMSPVSRTTPTLLARADAGAARSAPPTRHALPRVADPCAMPGTLQAHAVGALVTAGRPAMPGATPTAAMPERAPLATRTPASGAGTDEATSERVSSLEETPVDGAGTDEAMSERVSSLEEASVGAAGTEQATTEGAAALAEASAGGGRSQRPMLAPAPVAAARRSQAPQERLAARVGLPQPDDPKSKHFPARSRRGPVPALPARTATEAIVHVVVRGDTLWDLCELFLGDPFDYPRVARDNGIPNPDWIEPGQIIRFQRP